MVFTLLVGMFSFPAYAEGNTAMITGDGSAAKTGQMNITLKIKGNPSAPAAPTSFSVTKNSVTLNEVSGCEYSMDGASWQDNTEFTGLLPGTEYTFYQRIKATDDDNASPASPGATYTTEADTYGLTITLTIKTTPDAPEAPTAASTTKNSITLTTVSGCEYKLGDGAWQDSPEFSGLTPGTEYTFYQHIKATANMNPSAASLGATFSTEADTYGMTITLVIKPTQTITAEDVTATYGDTDKSVSASVTDPATGGGAITYAVKDGSGDYISVASDGKLTIKKVPPTDGKAYVIVKAAGTDTHAETTKEVTVTISKATVTITAKDQSIMVGGTVPTLEGADFYTVTGLVGQDTLTTAPTLAYQKNGSAATPDNTTAGTYDIVASGASAGDNYTITYANGTLTISEKQPATVTKAPTAKNPTYTGSAQELVTAGTAEGGTMQYALGTAAEATEQYTTSIPAKTDAGIYFVWYKVVGDENHNDTAPVCVKACIAKPFGPAAFTLPAGTKTVGESAFEGDTSITVVEIPSGCESIGANAFKGCTGLTQIRIPLSVNSIHETAFDGCTNVLVYGTSPSTAEDFCKAADNCAFVAMDVLK